MYLHIYLVLDSSGIAILLDTTLLNNVCVIGGDYHRIMRHDRKASGLTTICEGGSLFFICTDIFVQLLFCFYSCIKLDRSQRPTLHNEERRTMVAIVNPI